MNIGDRVRLLHGNEEGIITKISSGGRVEIEIEEGFIIPAMKNEVVVISSVEKQYFGEKEGVTSPVSEAPLPNTDTRQGVFLAFVPVNDKDHSLYLINNNRQDYMYAVAELHGKNCQHIAYGSISDQAYERIGQKNINGFESWPELHFQFIPLNKQMAPRQAAMEKSLHFKASSFFKSMQTAPLLDKKAYTLALTQNTQDLDIQQLNQDLQSLQSSTSAQTPSNPQREVDLHIEQLYDDPAAMENSEMLQLQLKAFEEALDAAIAGGLDEITFIHGVGNRVLSKAIHKQLSGHPHVQYFKDTLKNRFGYAGTLVRIK